MDEWEALIADTIKSAEQGALAFITGNGAAWMQGQAEAAAQRLNEAYDGPRDERPAGSEAGPGDTEGTG